MTNNKCWSCGKIINNVTNINITDNNKVETTCQKCLDFIVGVRK